ncbi:MAG: hypothetical protein HKN23_19050 [Verrucomicrobiales bacterium]|nr:hypothetical protein [Verrucomicrobiales bacterium]
MKNMIGTISAAARVRRMAYTALIAFGALGLGLQNAPETDANREAENDPTGSDRQTNPVDSKTTSSMLAGKVVVVPIGFEDFSSDRRFLDMKRLLEAMKKDKPEAVIFEIDITSGTDWNGEQRLIREVKKLDVPTFAFINTEGTGGGAILALATDRIYLAPGGYIGAAALTFRGGGKNEEMEKRNLAQSLSILRAQARTLAKENGYNPNVAEAMVDSELEVKIGDEVISKKGEILTLTADEAIRVIDGKPILATDIAESAKALAQAEEWNGEVVKIDPTEFRTSRNRNFLNDKKRNPDGSAASETPSGDQLEGGPLFGKREGQDYSGKVVVIDLGFDSLATGKASFDFMDRTLKKAELDGAEAVILELQTPGGFAWYTEGLVLDSLQAVSMPTYAFVNKQAVSAGAIVAIGTDHIYMAPAATIGSALVVGGGGMELSESMRDKVTQEIKAMVENVAVLKGHNPDIAKAMVSTDTEVVIDGITLHEKGSVLNWGTNKATEVINGKPVLAKGVARNVEALAAQEGLEGEIVAAKPLGMESFAHWVQKFSFVLLIVGLGGVYAEMKAPGFGLPGLIAVGAFTIYFFGNHAAGNLAGYELAVLLVIGLVLLGVEIFLFPGTLVAGALGGILIFASLILAMMDRVDFQWKVEGMPGAPSWTEMAQGGVLTLAAGLVGTALLIYFGMRHLQHIPIANRLILRESLASGAGLEQRRETDPKPTTAENYIGLEGKCTTDLRPAGKGEFGGKQLDITADGEFIDRGTPIRIVKHEGSRVVVERV